MEGWFGCVHIWARVRARGAANRGARVAWVLFEMRTLSKAASEKRPDERRKDTSVLWDTPRYTADEEEQTGRTREREAKVRVFYHPLGHPPQTSGPGKGFCFTHCNFPVGASYASLVSLSFSLPLSLFCTFFSNFFCPFPSFFFVRFIQRWNVDGNAHTVALSRNICNCGRYFFSFFFFFFFYFKHACNAAWRFSIAVKRTRASSLYPRCVMALLDGWWKSIPSVCGCLYDGLRIFEVIPG